MKVKEMNNAVFVADASLVKVGKREMEFLKDRVDQTALGRIRLCAHRDIGDKLQEMFIVLSQESYIRPHKHLNKAESLHVIEGLADAVCFDENGNITEIIALGEYLSGKQFFYQIVAPIYHTLIIRSKLFIYHEATHGPFRRSDTVFAPWSPDERDPEAKREFMLRLLEMVSGYEKAGSHL